jgi:two-component system OmpR family response regulator
MFDTSEPITAAGGPVVLVVDDTDAVREVVSLGLRRQGFEVRAADNGRDAIELYHELRQQNRDVTVLLDVQMPGLDGPLVLAALQALDPGVRAYFMTGDPGQYGEYELVAMGGRRVFPKPLDLAAVAAEFRRRAAIPDRTGAVAEAVVRGPRPVMAGERV